MKIIISGAGSSGMYLAKMLYQAKKDIVVVDKNKDKLSYLDTHYDFLTILGSSTSFETLKQAGVQDASLFIAVTESEETNIVSAMLAKRMGAKKVIARIDNQEYLKENYLHNFKELGIDELVYPEILATQEIVDILSQSGATKTYKFSDGNLIVFAIKLDSQAPLIGRSLLEVSSKMPDLDFRAVAITRNRETIIPRGYDIFRKDDLVYAICHADDREDLMHLTGKIDIDIKNIMILGGSRIGWKTAQRCESKTYVKVIEKDRTQCDKIVEQLTNAIVIHGDGRDSDLLAEEGIENTDAFIAVTGDTETNILSCLHAKRMGVRKTIAEVENIEYLQLAENLGIDTVINKKLIMASYIYAHVIAAQVESVQILTASQAEILEFFVPENVRITKKALRDIKFPDDAIIGGVIRGKECFIAKGDTIVEAGDKVVVFALPDAIDKVSKFFR
jgi:trk system potassium uptake protein TrkA